MSFFSKVVANVNLCFWIMVVMRYIEINKINSSSEALISSPIQSTVVVLGMISIALNALFLSVLGVQKMRGKNIEASKWIIAFNLLTFFGQLIYHFV
jgi:hypothetical protein